jgi:organic radical activating enzyme
MKIKGIRDEDFTNYKKPSMYIAFPSCTFKCEKECGQKMCQNSALVTAPDIDIDPENIVQRYLQNPITKAIVFGGLEPVDSWDDMVNLINEFRKYTEDEIVIYTGYKMDEICKKTYWLGNQYKNIIFKLGRFIPNKQSRYDEILGINLASNNQYAEVIS